MTKEKFIIITDLSHRIVEVSSNVLHLFGIDAKKIKVISQNIFALFQHLKYPLPIDASDLNQGQKTFSYHFGDKALSTDVIKLSRKRMYLFVEAALTSMPTATQELLFLRKLINTVPHAVFWKDQQSRFLGCNDAFATLVGMNKEDIVGLSDFEMPWTREESEKYIRDDQSILNNKAQKLFYEEQQTDLDGKTHQVLVSKIPFKLNDQSVGIICIYQDITDLKKAQGASQAKSAFIANMSHDIRTPITGILGLAQSLYDNTTEHSTKEEAACLITATNELLKLLNDILATIELESGQLRITEQPFSLRQLIDHHAKLIKPAIGHAGLSLTIDIDAQLPDQFFGNFRYLDRILLNLLGNAIKFTPSGAIQLKITGHLTTNQRWQLCCQLKDTGIGIAKDQQEKIFEHFYKVVPSYKGRHKGSGIGLYMVKQYLQAMEGDIKVKSELGKGSCFTITLPLALSDDKPQPLTTAADYSDSLSFDQQLASKTLAPKHHIPANQSNTTILIVEDNPLAARTVSQLLAKLDVSCDIVASGEAGVSAASAHRYDLILMDIGLPGIDGIEATQQIRQSQGLCALAPIVALTGHLSQQARQDCLKIGMQEVVNKPAPLSLLASLLARYVFKKDTASTNADSQDTAGDKENQSVVIDWQGCMKMYGDDTQSVHELLSVCANELKTTQAILQKAYAKKDNKALREELHRCLGGVCYLRLPQLEQALKAFQCAVKAKPQDHKQLASSYDALGQAIEAFWHCYDKAN